MDKHTFINAFRLFHLPPQSCQFARSTIISDNDSFRLGQVLTFHGNHQMNRVLVFHLANVDLASSSPFAGVGSDIFFQSLSELFEHFERCVVAYLEVSCFPPGSITISKRARATMNRYVHSARATDVMDKLDRRQKRIGSNDLLSIDPSERSREQSKLFNKQGLSSLLVTPLSQHWPRLT